MSNLLQYGENLKRAIEELKATRTRETTLMMLDEVAVVKARVINTGESAEGGGFNPYSPAYKKLREKKTRPTAYRNFSMTGEMWKKVEPIVTESDDVSTTYIVNSTEDRAHKLIGYNKASGGGDFLLISDKEQALLHTLNRQRVLNILRKHNVIA